MNELIEKLSKEAWHQVDVSKIKGRHRAYTKIFAELLVLECMEQVWYTREDGINGNVSEVIKGRIKQHFGVEL